MGIREIQKVARCWTRVWDTVDGENIAPPNHFFAAGALPPTISLRPRRVSARARAFSPLSIPGFNVAFFEGKVGDVLFHLRSPVSSPAVGTGRHPRALPMLNAEGEGSHRAPRPARPREPALFTKWCNVLSINR